MKNFLRDAQKTHEGQLTANNEQKDTKNISTSLSEHLDAGFGMVLFSPYSLGSFEKGLLIIFS